MKARKSTLDRVESFYKPIRRRPPTPPERALAHPDRSLTVFESAGATLTLLAKRAQVWAQPTEIATAACRTPGFIGPTVSGVSLSPMSLLLA